MVVSMSDSIRYDPDSELKPDVFLAGPAGLVERELWGLLPNPRSVRFDVGCADHLAPLVGFLGDELSEISR